MDELLEQFVIEGRDLVSDAHEALSALSRNPADAGALDSGFRTFHTLKGSAAIVGLASAERVLHAAEEVLSAARKLQYLAPTQIAPLTACIDQVDRWIEAIERDRERVEDAGPADMLIDTLATEQTPAIDQQESEPAGAPPWWLSELIAQASDRIGGESGPLVGFRYAPDPDCFYRGEDPLALAAAVPGLKFLRLVPVGPWPALGELDPFRCAVIIEGVSGASIAELRQLFRLLPDQVEFARTDRATSAPPEIEPMPDRPTTRGLRIDADRLDRLAEDVREVIIATNGLDLLATDADRRDPALAARIRLVQAGIERATGRLRQSATALRRVALSTSLRRLPRLVREIAASVGKSIRFEIDGEGTEADKDIVDGLFEPLLHLARNAIDHGIEDAASRLAAGKSVEGKLALSIAREANEIVVTFEDDGRGIDPERVRDFAIERGILTPVDAERLSPPELQKLVFAPGFSTAVTVSEISGRGIGMDAVRAAMDRLGGGIELDSRIGEGTRFIMRLPVAAISTRLLVVTVGAARYAVPFDQILGTARLPPDRLLEVGTGRACVLRDHTVPVLSLAALLGEPEPLMEEVKLLITELFDGSDVALRVDDFEHAVDGVIRPRAGLLACAKGVQGTAIAPDGSVLLVLNLSELVG